MASLSGFNTGRDESGYFDYEDGEAASSYVTTELTPEEFLSKPILGHVVSRIGGFWYPSDDPQERAQWRVRMWREIKRFMRGDERGRGPIVMTVLAMAGEGESATKTIALDPDQSSSYSNARVFHPRFVTFESAAELTALPSMLRPNECPVRACLTPQMEADGKIPGVESLTNTADEMLHHFLSNRRVVDGVEKGAFEGQVGGVSRLLASRRAVSPQTQKTEDDDRGQGQSPDRYRWLYESKDRRWVMFDVDGLELRDLVWLCEDMKLPVHPLAKADPQVAQEALISNRDGLRDWMAKSIQKVVLPEGFRDCDLAFQWSSSAFGPRKGATDLYMHVFAKTEQGFSDPVMKAYVKSTKELLCLKIAEVRERNGVSRDDTPLPNAPDSATLGSVQPHYNRDGEYVGMEHPIKSRGHDTGFFVEGDAREVDLDFVDMERAEIEASLKVGRHRFDRRELGLDNVPSDYFDRALSSIREAIAATPKAADGFALMSQGMTPEQVVEQARGAINQMHVQEFRLNERKSAILDRYESEVAKVHAEMEEIRKSRRADLASKLRDGFLDDFWGDDPAPQSGIEDTISKELNDRSDFASRLAAAEQERQKSLDDLRKQDGWRGNPLVTFVAYMADVGRHSPTSGYNEQTKRAVSMARENAGGILPGGREYEFLNALAGILVTKAAALSHDRYDFAWAADIVANIGVKTPQNVARVANGRVVTDEKAIYVAPNDPSDGKSRFEAWSRAQARRASVMSDWAMSKGREIAPGIHKLTTARYDVMAVLDKDRKPLMVAFSSGARDADGFRKADIIYPQGEGRDTDRKVGEVFGPAAETLKAEGLKSYAYKADGVQKKGLMFGKTDAVQPEPTVSDRDTQPRRVSAATIALHSLADTDLSDATTSRKKAEHGNGKSQATGWRSIYDKGDDPKDDVSKIKWNL